MSDNSFNNKKIAKNSLFLYIDLIASSVLWLIASRILLQALGESDFGLYNVVGGIVVLLNIINASMVTTTYRYIAVEIGQNDGNPRNAFNASLLIHILFAVLTLIIGIPLGHYYIEHYVNLGNASLEDAIFVYNVSITTCALNTISIPFIGLVASYERFFFKTSFNILRNALRLLLIIALTYVDGDKLRVYAIFALIPDAVMVCCFVVFCMRNYYGVIRFRLVRDMKRYLGMFSFAFWLMVNALANVGRVQGAALLINFFFGTVVNAAYAIAHTVNGFINSATTNLAQAGAPQVTKSYSSGDLQRSLDIVKHVSKYSYIMMLTVCVPIFMQTDFILNLWLADVPAYTAIFVKLVIVDALLTSLGAGLSTLYEASGKVAIFKILLSIILLSSVLLGYTAFRLGYPPYSILICYCVMTLVDRIVTVILLKYKLKIPVRELISFSYMNSLLLTILIAPLYWLNMLATTDLQRFLMIILTELVLLCLVYFVGLKKYEQQKVSTSLKALIKKLKII
ncbi:MAG: hypothetical protein Q4E59_00880 [Bacteroidales bacterium]|nr:hypothetical protein [Bacteroidales bacterium]